MKISIEKYHIAKSLVLIYLLLSLLFFEEVSNMWSFRKLEHNTGIGFDFYFFRYLFVSIIVLFAIYFLSKIKITDFIYSLSIVIFIVLFIPSALLYSGNKSIGPSVFFSHNLFFYSIILISRIKLKIPIRKFNNKSSFLLLFLITIIGMIPYLKYLQHINLKNLVLKEIYDTRAVFKEVGDAYLGRTYSLFNKVILPALLAFAIFFRQKLIIVITIFLLIFLFLLGAHKSVILGVLIMLITYKFSYLVFAKHFSRIVIILTISCIVLSLIFDYSYLTIFTIRRGLFIPALLDLTYFDFFNNNHLYWSESIFSGLVEYKYDVNHSFVIGKEYFDKSDMGANNGIISDGFMNAGFIGVFINVLIISIYFCIVNNLNISNKFFGLFLLLLILIMSSSLTTILFTHGALVLLLLSIFFLKGTKEELDK